MNLYTSEKEKENNRKEKLLWTRAYNKENMQNNKGNHSRNKPLKGKTQL